MAARYVFKVGPVNRNSDYAHRVTVLANSYREAERKAIEFRGYSFRDSNVWFVSADEIDPQQEVLERLAELLKEKASNDN